MKAIIQKLNQERDKVYAQMLNTIGANVYYTHLKEFYRLSNKVIQLKLQCY